jgi:hypothetical protein
MARRGRRSVTRSRSLESSLGEDSQAAAEVLNALGVLGKFSGAFEEAERAYAKAARIIEARYGAEHPDMRRSTTTSPVWRTHGGCRSR